MFPAQYFGSDHPSRVHPRYDPDGDHHRCDLAPEDGENQQKEKESRDRQHTVRKSHENRLEQTAPEPAHPAHEHANHQRDGHGEQAAETCCHFSMGSVKHKLTGNHRMKAGT